MVALSVQYLIHSAYEINIYHHPCSKKVLNGHSNSLPILILGLAAWLALANGTIANVMQGVTWEMSGGFSFPASLGNPCNFHHVNERRRAWWTIRNTCPCHPHHLRWHWVNAQTCEGGHAGPLAPGKPAQIRTTQPNQGTVKTMNVCYFKQVVHYLAKANRYKGITGERCMWVRAGTGTRCFTQSVTRLHLNARDTGKWME